LAKILVHLIGYPNPSSLDDHIRDSFTTLPLAPPVISAIFPERLVMFLIRFLFWGQGPMLGRRFQLFNKIVVSIIGVPST
jgi:hypothetical protein